MSIFSHIYVEEKALSYNITHSILEKRKSSQIITIDDYKNIFNRPNQNFQAQKLSPKLILAAKKNNFLYKGSAMCDDFGNQNFYYNTLIQNCLYNCDYCYLQGMYESSNIVIFVNIEDFFKETDKMLTELNSKLFLCISYDTDLLALEKIVPYTSMWIQYANGKENLELEIRTKSNQFHKIASIEPPKNVILAWTVSPTENAKRYEKKAPTLKARLWNIKKALELGWRVRICLDPVLYTKDWQNSYSNMLKEVFSVVPAEKLEDVTVGVFRVNQDYWKNMKKVNPSEILHFPFQKVGNAHTYSDSLTNQINEFLRKELLRYGVLYVIQ